MTDSSGSLVGRTIGKYALTDFLGQGAMARVYRAYHSSLDRYVAIKVLHPHFVADANFIQRFNDEAKALATLRHPNIVQVYDFDIQYGLPYIVMEYVEGPTLLNFVRKHTERHVRPNISDTLRIIYNTGLALSYAHRVGMIHRDVKPGNVILENTGRVVLTDFGLARLLSEQAIATAGMMRGTPAYLSPEQAMGSALDHRADIYSLGAVLYELTTGKLPFDADTPLAVALKHVQEKLPPPSSVYPEISSLIEAIIVKAMEKDPAQRYQSVDFLLADLRKFSHKVRTTKIPTARLSVEAMPAGEYTDENLLLVSPEVGEEVQVSIHFVDTGQILNLERGREYTIGRRHRTQAVIPDIDLTPFKGYEWGISRLHAKVDLTQEDVKITDLGSSNGTWYDGKQIPKDTPYVLHHGDVVNLGKLRLQVLISN